MRIVFKIPQNSLSNRYFFKSKTYLMCTCVLLRFIVNCIIFFNFISAAIKTTSTTTILYPFPHKFIYTYIRTYECYVCYAANELTGSFCWLLLPTSTFTAVFLSRISLYYLQSCILPQFTRSILQRLYYSCLFVYVICVGGTSFSIVAT